VAQYIKETIIPSRSNKTGGKVDPTGCESSKADAERAKIYILDLLKQTKKSNLCIQEIY
jgi:hypothetical protein